MKEQRYKGVFFDLYGTLLVYGDMERAWEEWLDSILASMRKNGAEIERDSLREICSGFFNKPEPPRESNHTIYERRIGALGEQLGITLEGSEKTAISDHSVHSWTKYTTVDPEATRLLGEVHGSMRTALISNFIIRLTCDLDFRNRGSSGISTLW